jgi:hypothetical protein
MPGFDRTGPAGMGPMTGWGRGLCGPYGGRGGRRPFGPWFGSGGRGRGWRHWHGGYGSPPWGRGGFPPFYEPYYEDFYTRDEEVALLKEDAARLKKELNAVEERLSELESREGDEG